MVSRTRVVKMSGSWLTISIPLVTNIRCLYDKITIYVHLHYDTRTCSIVCHLVSHETHLNPGRQALPPTTIILFEISQRQSIGHCSNEEHITIRIITIK